jgi:large subunit ribosomal protein L23
MNSINFNNIILKPIITEKSLMQQEKGKYSFWVGIKANKNQIFQAFEAFFGIKPLNVNTLKLKGTNKTDWKKKSPIKKSDRKKAFITIPKNKKLELLKIKTK